jgi:hypothetical protein
MAAEFILITGTSDITPVISCIRYSAASGYIEEPQDMDLFVNTRLFLTDLCNCKI